MRIMLGSKQLHTAVTASMCTNCATSLAYIPLRVIDSKVCVCVWDVCVWGGGGGGGGIEFVLTLSVQRGCF